MTRADRRSSATTCPANDVPLRSGLRADPARSSSRRTRLALERRWTAPARRVEGMGNAWSITPSHGSLRIGIHSFTVSSFVYFRSSWCVLSRVHERRTPADGGASMINAPRRPGLRDVPVPRGRLVADATPTRDPSLRTLPCCGSVRRARLVLPSAFASEGGRASSAASPNDAFPVGSNPSFRSRRGARSVACSFAGSTTSTAFAVSFGRGRRGALSHTRWYPQAQAHHPRCVLPRPSSPLYFAMARGEIDYDDRILSNPSPRGCRSYTPSSSQGPAFECDLTRDRRHETRRPRYAHDFVLNAAWRERRVTRGAWWVLVQFVTRGNGA